MKMIRTATTPLEYNQKQTAVGSPLKTLKGSRISRSSRYGVGKEIGGDIYFHRSYAREILPEDVWYHAIEALKIEYPDFYNSYNCIRYSPKTQKVSFQEVPDFDTAREPVVGDYVTVDTNTGKISTGHSNYIFHHKWLWVKNNYDGFNVSDSWNWSKQWLSVLTEPSDGNGKGRWNAQLNRFNLPIEEATDMNITKKDVTAATEELSTLFYKIALKDAIKVLKQNKANILVIYALEQSGWDALDLEHNMYGSGYDGDDLYYCVTDGDYVNINGEEEDPETLLENYELEELAPMIVEADDKFIKQHITGYEITGVDLDEAAIDLLQSGNSFEDIAKAAIDLEYIDL